MQQILSNVYSSQIMPIPRPSLQTNGAEIPEDILFNIYSYIFPQNSNFYQICKSFNFVAKKFCQSWPFFQKIVFKSNIVRELVLTNEGRSKLNNYGDQICSLRSTERFLVKWVKSQIPKKTKEHFRLYSNDRYPVLDILKRNILCSIRRVTTESVQKVCVELANPFTIIELLLEKQEYEVAFALAELYDHYEEEECRLLVYEPIGIHAADKFGYSQKLQADLILKMGHDKALELTNAFNDKQSQAYAFTGYVIIGCKEIEIPARITIGYLGYLQKLPFIQSLNFFKTTSLPRMAEEVLLNQIIEPLLNRNNETKHSEKMDIDGQNTDENFTNCLQSFILKNFDFIEKYKSLNPCEKKVEDLKKILKATEECIMPLLKQGVDEFIDELENPTDGHFPKSVLNLLYQSTSWFTQYNLDRDDEFKIYSCLFKIIDKYPEHRKMKGLLIEAIQDESLKAQFKAANKINRI